MHTLCHGLSSFHLTLLPLFQSSLPLTIFTLICDEAQLLHFLLHSWKIRSNTCRGKATLWFSKALLIGSLTCLIYQFLQLTFFKNLPLFLLTLF